VINLEADEEQVQGEAGMGASFVERHVRQGRCTD
jgi:hypothetical protein